jgi:hypothetical protein|tara:strand:+ start:586 stop:945 length:360 start_codon:yes stop_codon:yes gene_type:complete
MPTYKLRNKKTNLSHEVFCSYPELQKILESDPDLTQMLTAPAIVGDHIVKQGDGRMDVGMKETFSRIAEGHPNSPLADRFGSSQTNQQKKVQEIGKKHGLVRKDGGQNVSKLTSTYKTT